MWLIEPHHASALKRPANSAAQRCLQIIGRRSRVAGDVTIEQVRRKK